MRPPRPASPAQTKSRIANNPREAGSTFAFACCRGAERDVRDRYSFPPKGLVARACKLITARDFCGLAREAERGCARLNVSGQSNASPLDEVPCSAQLRGNRQGSVIRRPLVPLGALRESE